MINLNKVPKALWLVPVALLALHPRATQAGSKTGIVNVQVVVASMPGGEGFVALSKKSDADLQAQAKTVQTLLPRAAAKTASTADRNAYAAAVNTYQASVKKYGKQLSDSFAPLANRVNVAVAAVAKAGGYSVVFDQKQAHDRGIVVYANGPATDLTAAVAAKLKAGK